MAKGNFVNYSLHALGLLSFLLSMQRGKATTFSVGGSNGWSVPSDNSSVFNQWAEKMRFQIGDSLLFVYPPTSDSVLRVTKEDYNKCTTTSPLEKYTDGHTEVKLSQSGSHYFISGNKDNCLKNEKLVVVVMADRSGKSSAPTQSPPSPPPSTANPATSPAPTVASDEPIASPPPTGTSDDTPAPSAESHPPNGAASFVMSFVGSVGAFVGSSLLLAF